MGREILFRTTTLAALAIVLPGCIRDVGPGPDLGACADYPPGVYTYGQVGIGTCLSGPADVRTFERDGSTWIAVTNADPFVTFGEGSLLLIDFDSIDLEQRYNPLDSLVAHALPMDRYVGGLGILEDRELALVSSRLSEEALTREAEDELYVVDLADLTSPELWDEGASLLLEDDPQPIAVHPDEERAYVLNITDHSVSVIDTSDTPLSIVELHGPAELSAVKPVDADGSGSRMAARISDIEELDVRTDDWTMSYVDGSYRVWVAEDGGLARWSTGGGEYRASALGVELDPADSTEVEELVDPIFVTVDGLPAMLFADRGAIRIVTTGESFDGGFPIGAWSWDAQEAVLGGSDDGWDYWIEGPSPQTIDDASALYYTGRADDGAPGSIGVARIVEGTDYEREEDPLLVPPTGWSYEQPFVTIDPFTSSYRMWLSVYDGSRWSIAVASSSDGLAWSEPEIVLAPADTDVAAPVVGYAGGRYLLWCSTRAGDASWATASAWSWDGVEWFDLQEVIPGNDADLEPPRPAVQTSPITGWRVEGANSGVLPFTATAGVEIGTEQGFSLHVSSGQEISPLDGDVSLLPDAHALLSGQGTLYATATDSEGIRRLIALQPDSRGNWQVVADDLVPAGEGGNAAGVQSAVVHGEDGAWTLYYAATDSQGIARLRRATSSDGLSWEPQDQDLLEPEAWDALAQLPHSVQELEDGSLRLWLAGNSGSLSRIGSVRSTDGGQSFEREPSALEEWQLGTGIPGDFDDSSVRDPFAFDEGGITHLYYSGFDGERWRVGHATRGAEDEPFVREFDPYTDQPVPAMSGVLDTFSTLGVRSPVGVPEGEDGWRFWYAGEDGFTTRMGLARRLEEHLFPEQRFATLGDEMWFHTEYGGEVEQVIELERQVGDFATTGIGGVNATLDPERGFLYVTSKLTNYIYVLDVRDDSDNLFQDSNFLDIEALLLTTSLTGSIGFRDVLPVPGTDLLYAAGRLPDALSAFDLSELVDDDLQQVHTASHLAALPTRASDEQEGGENLSEIGLADLELASDGHTLLAPHYNENSVYVYDLDAGPYGEEVALLRNIGENPHVARLTPDGRYAIVANYLGTVDEYEVSSSLAVVDMDPASDTYLEVLTWLVNK